MNLVIIKNNLKSGLAMVDKIAGDGSNLPILKNVLIETYDGRIKLTTTNLELAASSSVACKIIEPGSLTIPVTTLRDLVNNLPSERITIESKKNNLILKTDNYQAVIQGSPADDFPIIPKIKDQNNYIEIQGETLKNSLEQVIVSTQFSELRPELNSVLFCFNLDEVKLAATDSFRLAEKTIPKSQFTTNHKEEFRFLIPIRTAQEVVRVIKNGTVKIKNDPNQVIFEGNDFQIISRLVEGNFPDYSAVVPKEFNTTITIDKDELVNAIKLTAVFSSKVNEIRIKTPADKKGVLEIFSVNQGIGENTYLLPAKISGEAQEISFNWRYLQDGLKAISTPGVFWGINKENKPALLRSSTDPSYFYVLMPILKG